MTTLDHILNSYNLPRDLHTPNRLLSSSYLARDRLGLGPSLSLSDRLNASLGDRLGERYRLTREQKLLILLEFLGVDLNSERLGGVSGGLGSRLGTPLSGGLLGSRLIG